MEYDQKGREINPLISASDQFAQALTEHFNWYSGVPDSVLKKTQDSLKPFHFSSRENHAVGMAFGARMMGRKPCLLIQNSGLGLAIDALLGLFRLYKQGVVLIVSNRGELEWEEIQHQDWGEITIPLLASLNIPVIDFGEQGLQAIQVVSDLAYRENKIVVLLVHRGNLDE
jgi:sulfopyruvate decarboxylase subunit alpha